MKVSVRLFAVARELAGEDNIELDLPDGATVLELRRRLAASRPQLALALPKMLIAVDSEYAGSTTVISPGAEIACIPPVSGG
jgi:molybdopterin converting factor subunit 1